MQIKEFESARGQDAWQAYPVIFFSLSGGDYRSADGLARTLQLVIARTEEKYALQDADFRRYWFETGTPGFMIDKLRASAFSPEQFTNGIEVTEASLTDYQADDPDPIPLFYQTGYLTIDSYDKEFRLYKLRFPNEEVKYGFLSSLSRTVLGYQDADSPLTARNLVMDLRSGNVDSAMQRLISIFASIPYFEGTEKSYEQEWRNEVFLIFMLMGQNVRCEVHSSTGRADCIVETKQYIYIIEFKLDKTAEDALGQIEKNGYDLPYRADRRQLIMVGVNFSSKTRNIESWKVKQSGKAE